MKYSLRGVLRALGADVEMPQSHVFFVLDGHSHIHADRIKKMFTSTETSKILANKKHRNIHVFSTPESVMKRRTLVRNNTEMSIVEYCLMLCSDKVEFANKARVHCTGHTTMDMIGPFDLPAHDAPEVFKVPHNLKAKMYGSGWGGSSGRASSDDVPSEDPGPKPTDVVPFTYHGNSPLLYSELDHWLNAPAFLDMTANDGLMALHAVRARKYYLGFAFTPEHKSKLEQFITDEVFRAFQNEADALHEPKLAVALKKYLPETPSPKLGDPQPTPKAPPKPTPKAPPKAAAAKPLAGGAAEADVLARLDALDKELPQ